MNLYDATVPIFTKLLSNVDKWLDKAAAFADAKKFDVDVLASARLAPDQYAFVRQIQAEKTIAEIRQRVRTVLDYMATFKREDFAGAEERPCGHSWMGGKTMRGDDYLNHLGLPNFHFHLTTTYDIIRHNGLDLGKMDYLVDLPFLA